MVGPVWGRAERLFTLSRLMIRALGSLLVRGLMTTHPEGVCYWVGGAWVLLVCGLAHGESRVACFDIKDPILCFFRVNNSIMGYY